FDRNLKIVGLITCVRIIPSKVEINTTTAKAGSGQPPTDRFVAFHHAYTLGSALPDRVSRNQSFESTQGFREVIKKLFAAALKSRGQIHHQPADAKVARRHSPARFGLDQ